MKKNLARGVSLVIALVLVFFSWDFLGLDGVGRGLAFQNQLSIGIFVGLVALVQCMFYRSILGFERKNPYPPPKKERF